MTDIPSTWQQPNPKELETLERINQKALNSYLANPELIKEHLGIEDNIRSGGYSEKQINELIQNAADPMEGLEGRIDVVLTGNALYCANEGMAFQARDLDSIFMAYSSSKGGNKIGKFGIGFKSLLALTDKPQVFSKTISFGFDHDQFKEDLAVNGIDVSDVPKVRTAYLLDALEEAKTDSVLKEMLTWASSIIRVPLTKTQNWLSRELTEFPGETLLFSDKIGVLHLNDLSQGTPQTITWSKETPELDRPHLIALTKDINGEATTTQWVVNSLEHRPSPTAKLKLSDAAARDQFDVIWAVPVTGRHGRGTLWSSFPTSENVGLAGIINAPFHMNDDRVSIMQSLYNQEVLENTLPRLVTNSVPLIYACAPDPGRVVDVTPSLYGGEASWATKTSYAPIIKALSFVPCVPNESGLALLTPASIVVPAVEGSATAKELKTNLKDAGTIDALYIGIEDLSDIKERWINKRVITEGNYRIGKIDALLKEASKLPYSVKQLLEDIVRGGTLSHFRAAIGAAAFAWRSSHTTPEDMQRVQAALIIKDGAGKLRPADNRELSLPAESQAEESSSNVALELARDPVMAKALKMLAFRIHDAEYQLNRALRELKENPTCVDAARRMWRIAETMAADAKPEQAIINVFTRDKVPVITLDGSVRPAHDIWLPNAFDVPADPLDAPFLADLQAMGDVQRILAKVGAHSRLEPANERSYNDPTFDQWSGEALRELITKLRQEGLNNLRPGNFSLRPVHLIQWLYTLKDASPALRANLTLFAAESGYLDRFTPECAKERLGSNDFIFSPDLHWIINYGAVETSFSIIDIKDAIAPVIGIPNDLLPVPINIGLQQILETYRPSKINWTQVLKTVASSTSAGTYTVEQLHALYGYLAYKDLTKQSNIYAYTGPGQVRQIGSTSTGVVHAEEAKNHLTKYHPSKYIGYIFVPDYERAEALANNWGLSHLHIELKTEIITTGAEKAKRLSDYYPLIREVEPKKTTSVLNRVKIVACETLRVTTTNSYDDVEDVITPSSHYDKDFKTLYVTGQRKKLELFKLVAGALGIDLDTREFTSAHAELERQHAHEVRLNRTRAAESEADKLLAYLGKERAGELIPDSIRTIVEDFMGISLSPEQYFDVLKSIHGADLFRAIKNEFEDSPTRFTGGATTINWLEDLGFSTEFAGEKNVRMPEQETVEGPTKMPPLHDYQSDVLTQVHALLNNETEHQKAFITLPTGSGKTRVATESVVTYCAQQNESQLVLWIAQTNELCEQAVSSWKSVWRERGKPEGTMAISRLWDARRPENVPDADLHVVVATFQTLASLLKNNAALFGWLWNPKITIIDEAHGSLAPSYTEILAKLGLRTGQKPKANRFAIGLSATPYRGVNEGETERLAKRYEQNLIEPAQFMEEDAHVYLQKKGVLSDVEYDEIAGIVLRKRSPTKSDRDKAEKQGFLPQEAEIDMDQVVSDSERNNSILNHVYKRHNDHPERSSILFAGSVDHAIALAAALNMRGIKAASVSGSSTPAARRRAIEGFRSGEFKVLTNYGVLSEGFDAPKCDAVYVARPTFSPNRYLQMIGRGLRGPQNGGSERTLIVNVQDNVERFNGKLAFNELKLPWLGAK